VRFSEDMLPNRPALTLMTTGNPTDEDLLAILQKADKTYDLIPHQEFAAGNSGYKVYVLRGVEHKLPEYNAIVVAASGHMARMQTIVISDN